MKTVCGSDEPHPHPERSSPTRLSTSGHASYKGRSCVASCFNVMDYHRVKTTHTHTHTYIYIYIYIYTHTGEPRNRPWRTHKVSGGVAQLLINLEEHHATLRDHTDPLMETLLKPPSNRRLKRKWIFDETN